MILNLLFLFLGMMVLIGIFYKKVKQGTVIIRSGEGGQKVSFNGIYIFPLMHRKKELDVILKKLEIKKLGRDALLTKDHQKLEGRFSFYLRPNNHEVDILKVVEWLGEETIEAKALPIFKKRFEQIVLDIAKETNAEDWILNREKVKMQIIMEIGNDLNGFILDDLAIDQVKMH